MFVRTLSILAGLQRLEAGAKRGAYGGIGHQSMDMNLRLVTRAMSQYERFPGAGAVPVRIPREGGGRLRGGALGGEKEVTRVSVERSGIVP